LTAKQARLEELGKERRVLVYSFGACGKNLARQLRSAGVSCVIYDNAKLAVERAASEGFDTTAALDLDIPLIVAAGQNQLSILGDLRRPAYNLVEGLYAFDLLSAYGRTRLFSDRLCEQAGPLYEVHRQIDPDCQAEFLAMLLFRASLDVHHLAAYRTAVSRMWVPPPAIGAIRSFCDVGAYDGDTLGCMKAAFPGLVSTFAVEPNARLSPVIDAAAKRLGLTNQTFVGLVWSHRTKLDVHTLPNGMMVVIEGAGGSVAADMLDHITAPCTYDYVKLDVEGAEIAALTGGRNLVRRARCVAVAAYHFPNDILDIPGYFRNLPTAAPGVQWKQAFHHHSECFEDSIFYFYQ
jgi:FkbM family methyltransferase